MAFDHHATQTQQGRAVIAAVVDAAAQPVQDRRGNSAGQQRDEVALEFFANDAGQHLRQPFDGFEHDIADKAVADDHVHRALENIVAFHVATEVEGTGAQQFGGFLDHLIALDDFLADVQQAHGRTIEMIDGLRKRGAHDGELQQMLCRAVDIGPQIEHRGGATGLVGDGGRDRRPVYAVQRLEHITGNRHPGAGIAGRHAGVGPTVLDGLGGQSHGRVFFAAQSHLHGVVHGDDLGGSNDFETVTRGRTMFGQRGFDRVGLPDQQQPGIRILPDELERGRYGNGQTVVPAHAVYSDAYHGCQVSNQPKRSGLRVRPTGLIRQPWSSGSCDRGRSRWG